MPLRIWINAFIPETVKGYTRVIPKGANVGKTAIPLPALANLNPVNLWKDVWNWGDTGYLTDQRTFNDSPDASVRMRSWVELSLSPLEVTRMGHLSSGTTEVDMKNGNLLGFGVANMSGCHWTLPTIKPLSAPGLFPAPVLPGSMLGRGAFVLNLEAAAGDPLVSAAADIDYEGEFVIRLGSKSGEVSIEFNGKIDTFPSFEAYASLGGKTKNIFTADPPPNNTVTSLPGSATRPVSGTVQFP